MLVHDDFGDPQTLAPQIGASVGNRDGQPGCFDRFSSSGSTNVPRKIRPIPSATSALVFVM